MSLGHHVVVVALSAGISGVACADGGTEVAEPTCLEAAGSLTCAPLYGLVDGKIAPTFEQVYTQTLSKCAVAGCHDAERRAGGMSLSDADTAYAALLSSGGNGRPRVTPGDLACGRFIVRLETAGEAWSMPPSSHLSDTTLCSLRHWINNGAPR
jgi:hypothetical protein